MELFSRNVNEIECIIGLIKKFMTSNKDIALIDLHSVATQRLQIAGFEKQSWSRQEPISPLMETFGEFSEHIF